MSAKLGLLSMFVTALAGGPAGAPRVSSRGRGAFRATPTRSVPCIQEGLRSGVEVLVDRFSSDYLTANPGD